MRLCERSERRVGAAAYERSEQRGQGRSLGSGLPGEGHRLPTGVGWELSGNGLDEQGGLRQEQQVARGVFHHEGIIREQMPGCNPPNFGGATPPILGMDRSERVLFNGVCGNCCSL